jgi:hypothetical protein
MVEVDRAPPSDDAVRYLIIGRARSGTTLLHLVLLGHPEVVGLNDELKPEPFFTRALSTFTFGNDLPEERAQGLRRLFDAITGVRATAATRALGAKTVCNSAPLATRLVGVLGERMPELRIIHVVRNDLAALYGSAQLGRRSGIMHSWYKNSESRRVEQIAIARAPFTTFALGSLRSTRAVRALAQRHAYLEVAYEDYLKDPSAVQQALFRFVGVEPMPASWLKSEKVLPPPGDYIQNYAQAANWTREIEAYLDSGKPNPTIERADLLGKILERAKRLVR